MVRLTLLWMFVGFLSLYAFRDWYKALCGLILLMAVVQHPDFPKSVGGIQGLNPWNLTLFFVGLSWFLSRAREGLTWDMPKTINRLLLIYAAIIVISFLRALGKIDEIATFQQYFATHSVSFGSLFGEQIINCIKWVIPGLLLYDGCNSEKRFRLAVLAVLGVYFLLAIQVIRWMPLGYITAGEAMAERSVKILVNEIGYHRVNMSMLLAGGAWAMFSARDLFDSKSFKMAVLFACVVLVLGQALTGGRMGYLTWFAIAMMFGALKWRKLLIAGPIAAVAVIMLVPAVKERLMQGFDPDTYSQNVLIEELEYRDEEGMDLYTVTSGRTFAWPFVIEEIAKAPLIGNGREAMVSTGLAIYLIREYGEFFAHPHNMYLQSMMDNGLLGTIPLLMFFYIVWFRSKSLFQQTDCRECVVIGGICLAVVSALLIAGMGSQSFYPREGSVGMWCAIGLMLRVYVQYESARKPSVKDGDKEAFDLWHSRRRSGA